VTPRQSAIMAGERFYSTGRACKYGHAAQRYSSSGECVTCESERRERNTATRKVQASDWYTENKDRKLRESASWYATNIERAKHQRLEWRARNKAAVAAIYARRRAMKLNATPAWGGELTELIEREAFDLALRREAVTGFKWDVDHMVPLQAKSACGLHVWNNLQVIPAVMNARKFNKMMWTHPGEWLRDAA